MASDLSCAGARQGQERVSARAGDAEFPEEIRDFARAFVVLQKARQQADYAQDADAYRKSDVLGHSASAELAISRFEQTDGAARRAFAAHVLFRHRPS